jgi:hypothetical protein
MTVCYWSEESFLSLLGLSPEIGVIGKERRAQRREFQRN